MRTAGKQRCTVNGNVEHWPDPFEHYMYLLSGEENYYQSERRTYKQRLDQRTFPVFHDLSSKV